MSLPGRILRRSRGEYEEDPWGLDPDFVAIAEPLLGALQDDWWRVLAVGTEHVPADRPVLIVGNRGGAAPWPEVMLATLLSRAWGRAEPVRSGRVAPRRPRFVVFDGALGVPFTGVAVRRFGGIPAGVGDVTRLLREGQSVIVLPPGPEGIRGAWSTRRGLERFARFGFVEAAMAAGVPIVPVGIVAQPIVPGIVRAVPGARLAGRLAGGALRPLDLLLPAPGRAGLPPLGARWRLALGAPIGLADEPDDAGGVLATADLVRARVADQVRLAHAPPALLRAG